MKRILLVSHGLMAMGAYEASQMIVGKGADIKYLCLSEGKDIEEFKVELASLKEWLKDCKQLFVLADILGGSPYITTLNYLQENHLLEKARVITGLNLPLVMSIALSQDLDDKNRVLEIMEESKSGIQLFEIAKDEEEDDL